MTARTFAGRAVAITGAAGGLGRSLCLKFGAAGASVAALDRDPEGLQALSRDMTARGHRWIARCSPRLYAALMQRSLRSEISAITPPRGP